MKPRNVSITLWAGIALAFGVQAAEPTSAKPVTDTYVGGVKVSVDPTTGRLRPLSDAESEALSKAMLSKRSLAESQINAQRYGAAPADAAAARRTMRVSKSGAVSVRVPESSMVQMRAVIDADGNVQIVEGDASDVRQETDK